MPAVLDSRYGFTVDYFIQHILINEFDGKVKNERCRYCYQWKGVLIEETFGDDNLEVFDGMVHRRTAWPVVASSENENENENSDSWMDRRVWSININVKNSVISVI